MKLTKNYHDYSVYKERELYNNLLVPYGELLVTINALQNLNENTIDRVINEWNREYNTQIEEDLARHVKNLEEHSKEILKTDTALPAESIALFEANKVMLNVTTDYIRQKFLEIGVNEKAYGYNSEMVNNLMDEIVLQTDHKLETFATQSTINNLAQFIKLGAVILGFTEYRWRTQRDSKVRASHAAMDGRWFLISDENPLPAGYKPGIDWGCRCWMWEFR